MNLLAIDTSTDLASVALLHGEQVLHKEQQSPRTHAQHLLPIIDEMLQTTHLSIADLDGIVFGCGPGSFTGLRIACSIAKGLAFAHDVPLIPVSTLSSISFAAHQQVDKNTPILAVIDARMQEMYWAYFEGQSYQAPEHVSALSAIDLQGSKAIVLAGYGFEAYEDGLSSRLQKRVSQRLDLAPSAKTMIELVNAGNFSKMPASDAQPVYVRNQVTG